MRVDYPTYDLQRFFSKNAEKLKAQGLEVSRFTDVDLVARLGDFLETPEFTTESISQIVDKSPIKTSDWILDQQKEIFNKKGWDDRSIVREIKNLLFSKPTEPAELTRNTLDRLSNDVQILHSRLKDLDDPFFTLEKQQYRIQYEL